MNRNRRTIILAPIAALALTISVAACGSDDDSSADTTSAPAATDTMTTATMTTDTMTTDTAGGEMAAESVSVSVDDVTVSDPWIREPAEGQTRSAAYAVITNDSSDDVTLIGASAPLDGTIEVHETITGDDGTMTMQERDDGFLIPAGGSFTLEPGGPHIMFLDIDPAQITGTIDLTLIFDTRLEITVPATVRTVDDMVGGMSSDMTGTTMPG